MAQAYKQAGVDIDAGDKAVRRIQAHAEATKRPGVLGSLGAFGGMFDLSSFKMKEPVLVSGADGVGTKLLFAEESGIYDSIGVDAVAMCVNDIVAQGAEPLYFLDYIACGALDANKVEAIVSGVAQGCREAGAALIGGETAEMPGMYEPQQYDIAGFAVGLAEKSRLVTGAYVQEGDVLIGLASNGLHSNGFSLVRKIMADTQLDPDASYGLGNPLAEELLRPTRIYVPSLLAVLETHEIKGIAHITGGGLPGNIVRMLPAGLGAEFDADSWEGQPVFSLLAEYGRLTKEDLYQTFNMGLGMVLAVSAETAQGVIQAFRQNGEAALKVGRVCMGTGVKIGGEWL